MKNLHYATRQRNRNHFICSVRSKGSPQFEIYGAYFDGTQAQAIKYFRQHRRIKNYIKKSFFYVVSIRGNSLTIGWDC